MDERKTDREKESKQERKKAKENANLLRFFIFFFPQPPSKRSAQPFHSDLPGKLLPLRRRVVGGEGIKDGKAVAFLRLQSSLSS